MTGWATEKHAALLALTRSATPKKVRTALADADEDPRAALEAISGPQTIDGPSIEDKMSDAFDAFDRWTKSGIKVVASFDPEYPRNLSTVYDHPQLLWIRGELTAADSRSIAVVGTRQVSEEGKRRARKVAGLLVEAGFTIVSGLAAGVDTAAHTAAIESNGRTVAVIGTGVDKYYPRENRELQQQIARDFAVVSQFEPDATGRKWTFPQRNATMSGLALATVVVEASATSGARTQAKLALAHGRPVVLMRSLVDDHPWAREMSTRPGVRILDDLADVIRYIESDDAAQLSLA